MGAKHGKTIARLDIPPFPDKGIFLCRTRLPEGRSTSIPLFTSEIGPHSLALMRTLPHKYQCPGQSVYNLMIFYWGMNIKPNQAIHCLLLSCGSGIAIYCYPMMECTAGRKMILGAQQGWKGSQRLAHKNPIRKFKGLWNGCEWIDHLIQCHRWTASCCFINLAQTCRFEQLLRLVPVSQALLDFYHHLPCSMFYRSYPSWFLHLFSLPRWSAWG